MPGSIYCSKGGGGVRQGVGGVCKRDDVCKSDGGVRQGAGDVCKPASEVS